MEKGVFEGEGEREDLWSANPKNQCLKFVLKPNGND